MIGSILALAECTSSGIAHPATNRSALKWHLYTLVPLTTLVAIICGYFALTAPRPAPGTDIVALLTMAGSTEAYNLSLSHVTDLTAAAMGFFRGPLAATALGMLGIGLISYLHRRKGRTYAANLTLAAAMISSSSPRTKASPASIPSSAQRISRSPSTKPSNSPTPTTSSSSTANSPPAPR